MVWHFFRKDTRLLWPLALAVVALQALCALRTSALGYFDEPPVLERLTFFLPYLIYLGVAIVAVTVVQQEPLSGTQEDWVIRPIRRRDLVLSKVLFVLLMVNIPLMFIDVVQQLALHFPVSVSIGVALFRFLVMVAAVSLPALLLGAVTRSIIDAFVFGIASTIGFTFLTMFATSAVSPEMFGIGGQAGMSWISVAAAGMVMSLGGAAVLAFQYLTRRTFVARGIGLAVVLAALCTFISLPRTAVIAAQEAVWGASGNSAIKLSFDSARPLADTKPEQSLNYGPAVPAAVVAARAADLARTGGQMEQVRLPLSISGLPTGNVLFADRAAVRISAVTGKRLYEGAGVCIRGSMGWGVDCRDNGLEVRSKPVDGAELQYEQRLNLPSAVYNRIKDEPVRVEISYVLTRFAPQPSQQIGAVGDLKSLTEMGSCATRIDRDGDEVELACLSDVEVPSCTGVVLEDPQTNQRNPGMHLCSLNYGPFHHAFLEDAVGRSQLSIPFRDLSGLVHYPVDGAAIERARIVLTAFDPVEHFRSSIVLPTLRLEDWRSPVGSGSE
jgi:hypothetical protein